MKVSVRLMRPVTASAVGLRAWWVRRRRAARGDRGMATAEYAIVLLAAVAFAGVLYKVVSSAAVRTALEGLVKRALSASF
ncbi:DUF4244 domain-containing protein [Streptomyces sp. NPDC060194]|uniref:DUF4244 domain-containing protein n=1 Tax=Streptomyces sp. NPDC060194 TaxID=3347069 RepID=UPI00365FE13B